MTCTVWVPSEVVRWSELYGSKNKRDLLKPWLASSESWQWHFRKCSITFLPFFAKLTSIQFSSGLQIKSLSCQSYMITHLLPCYQQILKRSPPASAKQLFLYNINGLCISTQKTVPKFSNFKLWQILGPSCIMLLEKSPLLSLCLHIFPWMRGIVCPLHLN